MVHHLKHTSHYRTDEKLKRSFHRADLFMLMIGTLCFEQTRAGNFNQRFGLSLKGTMIVWIRSLFVRTGYIAFGEFFFLRIVAKFDCITAARKKINLNFGVHEV